MKSQSLTVHNDIRFWINLILLILITFAQAMAKTQPDGLSGNAGVTLSADDVPNPELTGDAVSDEIYKQKTFKVDGPVNLEAATPSGHIKVVQGRSDEVEVKLILRSGYSLWGRSNFNPDDYRIMFTQNGNNISAVVERRSGSRVGNQPSLSFVITAPAETSTSLQTSGGHIEISGISGRQQVRTSGGHITFEDASGNVRAQTSGGHITLKSFSGEFNGSTSGGHINLNEVAGTIEVRTSGGHITADRVSGSLVAATSGGNIRCTVIDSIENLNMRTSGGNINAVVPSNFGYTVNLRGSLVNLELDGFSGRKDRSNVNGTVGDGGAKIELATSGGVVSLSGN